MIPSRAWVVALLFCATSLANAQSRTVTGSVLEEGTRTPLPSAQIIVKGTTIGTLTRENGTFTLQVPAGAQVLTVRRIHRRHRERDPLQSAVLAVR